MMNQMTPTEEAKQQFMVSIMSFLRCLLMHMDEERRPFVQSAVHALMSVFSLDYPETNREIYHTDLLTVYSWHINAQISDIENIHQRILHRILNFFEQEIARSNDNRLEGLVGALQSLQNLQEVGQAGGDFEDTEDLLTLFNHYQAYRFDDLGNQFLEGELYEAALLEYNRAVELHGTNSNYYANRAVAHIGMGNYQGAVEDCSEAVLLDPRNAKAYARLGTANFKQGLFKQARDAFQSALIINPANATYQEKLKLAEMELYPKVTVPLYPVNVEVEQLMNDVIFVDMISKISRDPEVPNRFMEFLEQVTVGGRVNLNVFLQRLRSAAISIEISESEIIAAFERHAIKEKPCTSSKALEEMSSTSDQTLEEKPSTSDQELEEFLDFGGGATSRDENMDQSADHPPKDDGDA